MHDNPQHGQVLDRFSEGAEAFKEHISLTRNLSVHTQRAYERDLAEFLAWLAEILPGLEPGDLSSPNHGLFRELPGRFISFLSARGVARSTVARKTSALRSFFKFLVKERYFENDQLPTNFRRPRLQKKLPDFLLAADIDQLLNTVETLPDSALKFRNLAIVETLFSSGIRVSELTALNFEDVNWDEGELRVSGKGGRERISFVSEKALGYLEQYQRYWPELSEKGEMPLPRSPVFLNYSGGRLSNRSVARALSQIAEDAELAKSMHPHIFRHTFATHLLNNGVDLRVVQELLGHVSIRSTQIYTHVTTERLKKAYLQAHPRAQESAESRSDFHAG